MLSWSGLEAGLLIFYGAISTPVVALLLGPGELGKAGVIMAVIALVEIVAGVGIQDALIRSPSSHTRLTDSANTAVMALSLAGMAAILLAAGPIARLYGDPELEFLLQLASVVLPLNALIAVPVALLTRKFRAKLLSLRNIAARTLIFAVTIALGWAGLGAKSVVLGTIAGSAASAVLILAAAPRFSRVTMSWQELKPVAAYGSTIGCENLIVTGFVRVFALVLGYLHGVTAVGYFQLGQRLVDEIALIIQTMITRYGVAYFAALRRAGKSPRLAFLDGTRLLAAVSMPAFAGLALCAHDLVLLVFGETWLPAVPILQFSALAWMIAFPKLLMPPLLRAQGHQTKLVAYSFVSAAVALGCLAGSLELSLWAVGAAWAARQALVVPWTLYAGSRYFGISAWSTIGEVWRPVSAIGLMAAVITLGVQTQAAALPITAQFALSVAAGAITYVGAMALLDRQLVSRARALFKRDEPVGGSDLPMAADFAANKT